VTAGLNLRPPSSLAAGISQSYYEGWIVATPDRRRFAVRITSYPALDISIPFEWNATAAEVTERVRAAMDD
jgi:hypothetical protein